MVRVTVFVAAFAASLAAQCSRKQWKDVLAVVDTIGAIPASNSTFLTAANSTEAMHVVLTAYNVQADTVNATAINETCWSNCVDAKFTDLYTALKSGPCVTNTTNTACKNELASELAQQYYCGIRHVVPQTTSWRAADIDAAAAGAYTSASDTADLTEAEFRSAFGIALNVKVPYATSELGYSCYADYYYAKYDGSGTVATADTTAFTACKALNIATKGTSCPQEAIDFIEATTTLQETLVGGLAQPDYTSLPLIVDALQTDLNITNIKSYACYTCEESYLMSRFDSAGAETDCDATCLAALKSNRTSCLEDSLLAVDPADTTTGSGVIPASLSMAAVIAVALANL